VKSSVLTENLHTHLKSALLLECLEVLVDDRHREQNTSTGANCTEEVGNDRQRADAHTTERRSDGDVPVKLLLYLHVTVALDDHLLLLELLSHISGGGASDFDPSLREQRTSGEHEGDVEDGVERVGRDIGQRRRRRDVINQTAGGDELSVALTLVPATEELNEEITTVSLVQELRDEIEVRHQRRLQDDRHVGGVEELDGIVLHVTTVLLRLDRQIDTETLEVDHDEENQDSRQQVRDVRQVRAVEGFLQRANLVGAREHQVEKRDDCAFKLSAAARVDGGRGESLPDDGFALVRCDEERDTRSQTVTLLKQLIEADDDDAREEELDYDEHGVTDAEISHVTVNAADDVRHGFTDGDQNSEQLLRPVQKRSVLLHALVHLDDLRPRQELDYQARGDDWRDTELHTRAAVTRHDDSSPIERIRSARRVDPVQRQLRAHQEDEERHARVERLFTKRNLAIGRLDFR